ncbi:MAG: glycogen/starch synthase [Bacteroidales bacterium]|nr:glycogen/starch synthase [Candidatus Physcousia equi]
MENEQLTPGFIFESSWEVCNKVGGIYTVLSTRAKTLQDKLTDKVVFIGPDFWQGRSNPLFLEDRKFLAKWVQEAAKQELHVRVGRWNIPGRPIVILVDFTPYFAIKNEIYGTMYAKYQVDSLHAYGDYDEASMFSYAAGRVVESYFQYYLAGKVDNVVYQAHEWMTGLGALYIKSHVPQIATIFTTHATSIGRSICGNNKPLYTYLNNYNGNQMAQELNMEAKHSIERQTAHNVDCFTTVSDVTGLECEELLDKKCDDILMNGFEADFVPKATHFGKKRKQARAKLLEVANALTGAELDDETLIVATSGRYEFKNKGLDVFIDAMHRLAEHPELDRNVLAFIEVPAWQAGPREDLKSRLESGMIYNTPLENPILTHNLHEYDSDRATGMMRWLGMNNDKASRVKLIFVPCYLDGEDGIFNTPYYDLLIGNDLSVYPSYYEPWGYTPLESIAFKVPCITTSLSGFGMWANKEKGAQSHLEDGVEVIERNDYNFEEVSQAVCDTVLRMAQMNKKQSDAARKNAAALAEKALWKNFIQYYYSAYDHALQNMHTRMYLLNN